MRHFKRQKHRKPKKQTIPKEAMVSFKRVFESNMFGMIYGDFQGKILDANDAFLEMIGYSLEEFRTGQVGWKELTPEEYATLDAAAIQELREFKIFKPYEKQFIRKDGHRIDVLMGAMVEEISPESAVAFVVDITAKKQFERALLEGEKRFRTLAESSPMMVWLHNPSHQLIYANKRLLDFNGTSFEELAESRWEQVIYPDDLGRSLALLEKDYAAKSYHENEFRVRRADGKYRWVFASGGPVISPEGELIGYVGTALDIHDRKMAEEALANYAQRLEQSNKELEHFATVASHDLQEPLRKVMIFTEHLKQIQQSSLSEEAIDDLERIQRATSRMQRLINDLLDLSRITRRGQPFQKVDLNAVTNEVIAELSYTFKDIRERVELVGSMIIDADSNQMHQMIAQLLDNALKFHQPGQPSVVKVTIQPIGDTQCQISIADNGLGIKPEYIGKIFDTFVRLQGKEYPGTGIGLALVQKIVERHGGNITVTSTPGQGSVFVVTLPVSHN